MSTQEKLPPHSPDMEQAALGSVLSVATHSPAEARKMLTQLRQSLFYELRNQQVFTALYRLAKDGPDLSLLSVRQWLNDKEKMEDAGGLGYVSALTEQTPSEAMFDNQVGILREKACRRELIKLAAEADSMARDESKDPGALVRQFSETAARIASNGTERREWICVHSPSQCRAYVPPDGLVLVGEPLLRRIKESCGVVPFCR